MTDSTSFHGKGCGMNTDSPESDKPELSRIESLLRQESYTPEQAAEILDMSLRSVHSAVFRGHLKAHVVNHDIVSIDRSDLIAWLRDRP
jgi:RecA/RadA recombinase